MEKIEGDAKEFIEEKGELLEKIFINEIEDNLQKFALMKDNSTVEQCAEVINNLYKLRHELFASNLLKNNDMDYSGDTRIVDYVLDNVNNEKRLEDFKNSRFYNNKKMIHKTPDFIHYFEQYNKLMIIDFSVRNNSETSFKEKREKYESIRDELSEVFDCSLIIINFSPLTELIDCNDDDDAVGFIIRDFHFNHTDIIRKIEHEKDEYIQSLKQDEKRLFEEIVYSSDKDSHSIGMKINFDFAMNKQELDCFLKKNERVVQKIKNDIGEDFLENLYEMRDNNSYDSDEVTQRRSISKNEECFRKTMNKFLEEIEEKEITGDLLDERLKRPSLEEIQEAYSEMEEKSAEYFNKLQEPKMISPFILCKSFHRDIKLDDESNTKLMRLERFRDCIKELKNDPISCALKEIFMFKLPKECDDQSDDSSCIVTGKTCDIKIVEDEIESFLSPKGDYISLKKGGKSQLIRNFELGAGYGKKEKEKRKKTQQTEEYVSKKIDSLSFWDEEDLKSMNKDFKQMLKSTMNYLESMGSDLKIEDEFLDDYMKITKDFGRNCFEGHIRFKETPSDSEQEDSSETVNTATSSIARDMIKSISRVFSKSQIKDTIEVEGSSGRRLRKRTISRRRSSSGSDVGEEEGDEGLEKYKFENIINVYKGVLSILRDYETISENILHVATKGSRNYRIVQGTNSNQIILLMPGESILKSGADVSGYCLSIIEDGKVIDLNNIKETYETSKGTFIISKAFRLTKNKISNYNQCKSKFISLIESYNSLLQDNSLFEADPLTITKVFFLTINVNINTSAMFDNIRYMVDNCLADLSCCSEYLTDKFILPCKNLVQIFIYHETKKLLSNLNKQMLRVRESSKIVNEGGIDLSSARLKFSSFNSILNSDVQYQKLSSLLQEIQILFFSTPKGLHGKYHNLISITKTPLEIQRDINDYKSKNGIGCMNYDKTSNRHRTGFSWDFMKMMSGIIEKNLTKSDGNIREELKEREYLNESPLLIKTMTSTRSIMIKAEKSRAILMGRAIRFENIDYQIPAIEINIITNKINSCKSMRSKHRSLKIEKRRLKAAIEYGCCSQNEKLIRKSKIDSMRISDSGSLSFIESDLDKKRTHLDEKGVKDFYVSGTVLTEIIKEVGIESENYPSISKIAKEKVLSDIPFMSLVREKGQRTKSDREIYVTNLPMKSSVYILEHMFKTVSTGIKIEKISLPGDTKILDLNRQVNSTYTHEYKEKIKGKNVFIYNMNLDMTKWAPKDNLLKFLPFICNMSFLKKDEKNYVIACLIKYYSKKLIVSEEILYKMSKGMADGKDYKDSCFTEYCFGGGDGSITNEVEINESWLQGQLNYPSSVVHAAMMLFYKSLVEEYYRKRGVNVEFISNVHSDDNQTTIVLSFFKEAGLIYDEEGSKLWSMLGIISKECCIELSIKKSNISKSIKQFVSQYNISGEQVYLWVKQLVSCVSGVPFTDFKGDLMSVYSKVSEAASKGASERSLNAIKNSCLQYICRVYGVNKKKKNVFSEKLNVREELLPLCLGNNSSVDNSMVALLGPDCIDRNTLCEIMKQFAGTSISEPAKETTNSMYIKALKVFYVIDKLTCLSYEEEMSSSINQNLNPFKPTRFKTKIRHLVDPFYYENKDVNRSKIIDYKIEHPMILTIKPRDKEGLMNFYRLLYDNPGFKASLAGQSPNQLLAYKISCRNTGNFKFLKENDIVQKELEQERRDSNRLKTFNAEEVSDMINKMCSGVTMSLAVVKYMWNKYIASNTEFQILKFTSDNCTKDHLMERKNPMPVRKPKSENTEYISNPISLILLYFYDQETFKSESRSLKYPGSLTSDFTKLIKGFPELYLSLDKLSKEDPRRYVEFLTFKKTMNNVEKNRIDLSVNGYMANERINNAAINNIMKSIEEKDYVIDKITTYKILKNNIIRSKENIKTQISKITRETSHQRRILTSVPKHLDEMLKSNNIALENLDKKLKNVNDRIDELEITALGMNTEEEEVDEENEKTETRVINTMNEEDLIADQFNMNLAENLLKISRHLSQSNQKVIFISPTNSRNITDVYLSLKGLVEGNFSNIISYSISSESIKKAENTIYNMKEQNQDDDMNDFALVIGNVYNAMTVITKSREDITRVLKAIRYKKLRLDDINNRSITRMSKKSKRSLICPLSMLQRDNLVEIILESLDPLNIFWKKAEVGNEGEFDALITGLGVVIQFRGSNKKIRNMEIYYNTFCKYDLDHRVHILTKHFVQDLYYRKQYGNPYINLSIAFDRLNPVVEKTDQVLFYDVERNLITSKKKTTEKTPENFRMIPAINIIKEKGMSFQKKISNTYLDIDLRNVVYKNSIEDGMSSFRIPKVDYYVNMSKALYTEECQNWRSKEKDKDIVLRGLNITLLFTTGVWRKLCSKEMDFTCRDASIITSYIGALIENRGPVHSKLMFSEITGIPVDSRSDEKLERIVESVLIEKDTRDDKNFVDFQRQYEMSLQTMNRQTGKHDFEAGPSILVGKEGIVEIYDEDIIECLDSEEFDEYIGDDNRMLSEEGINPLSVAKPNFLSPVEESGIRLIFAVFTGLMRFISDMRKADVLRGSSSDMTFMRRIKNLELYIMHCNVNSYLMTRDYVSDKSFNFVDSHYNDCLRFFKFNKFQIRPEINELVEMLKNAREEALRSSESKRGKSIFERLGVSLGKGDLEKKLKDKKDSKTQRILKSSGYIIGPIDEINITQDMSTHSESVSEYESEEQMKTRELLLRSKRRKTMAEMEEIESLQSIRLRKERVTSVKMLGSSKLSAGTEYTELEEVESLIKDDRSEEAAAGTSGLSGLLAESSHLIEKETYSDTPTAEESIVELGEMEFSDLESD